MIAEHAASIRVPSGPVLEASVALPPSSATGVVVCHPHPLYGGDMDNPVVLAVARACTRAGLAVLRFNFRGVGGSHGAWDEGRGEQDDVRAALGHLRGLLAGPARVALAGYSFGAAMALAVAVAGEPLAGLALVAPPLAAPGWREPAGRPVVGPALVVAGGEDAYCPSAALGAFAAARPELTVRVIEGADHFFQAGRPALEAAVADWAARVGA